MNKSKRTSLAGRDRWPSTESIAKLLRATGATLEDFLELVEPSRSLRRSIPLIGMTRAGAEKFTAEGLPNQAPGWDTIEFPDFGQEQVFALAVTGDSLRPFYRDGDVFILSPTARIRHGDRVVMRLMSGEVLAQEFRRRTASSLELVSLGPAQQERTVPSEEVAWVARIMAATTDSRRRAAG